MPAGLGLIGRVKRRRHAALLGSDVYPASRFGNASLQAEKLSFTNGQLMAGSSTSQPRPAAAVDNDQRDPALALKPVLRDAHDCSRCTRALV